MISSMWQKREYQRLTASEIIEMSEYLEDARLLRKLIKHAERGYWIGLSECGKDISSLSSSFARKKFESLLFNLLGEVEDIIAGSKFEKYDGENKNVCNGQVALD